MKKENIEHEVIIASFLFPHFTLRFIFLSTLKQPSKIDCSANNLKATAHESYHRLKMWKY